MMKFFISFALVLAIGASAASSSATKGPVGAWRFVRAIVHGQEIDMSRSRVTRTFDGEFIVVRTNGTETLRARYTVDEGRNPKRMDVTYLNAPQGKPALHGIYEISGDELKICMPQDGGPAPVRFESTAGSQWNLDFYERVK